MNTYYVKTDEQYASTVVIKAEFYSVRDHTLDFWVTQEDGTPELVASFWNMRWNYVEKAGEVEDE